MDNLPERKTSALEILQALSITDETWKQAGLEFNSIVWVGEAKTTKSKWDAKRLELEAEWITQGYARNRTTEYPIIVEQLDLLFHDMTAGKGTKSGEWYKAIAKVKADNPKG